MGAHIGWYGRLHAKAVHMGVVVRMGGSWCDRTGFMGNHRDGLEGTGAPGKSAAGAGGCLAAVVTAAWS